MVYELTRFLYEKEPPVYRWYAGGFNLTPIIEFVKRNIYISIITKTYISYYFPSKALSLVLLCTASYIHTAVADFITASFHSEEFLYVRKCHICYI